MRLTIVLSVLLIAGCNKYAEEHKRTKIDSTITEIIMEDGTRCIVYHNSHQGGLSCDFSKEQSK